MSISVLDPTAVAEGPEVRLAPALDTVAGHSIGLLDNSKYNVAPFLDQVEAILRTQYGVREVVRARKPDASRPAPEGVMQSLAGCDAILPAVGD